MRRIITMIMVSVLLQLCAGYALAGENGRAVLFDQGHGQRFLIEEKGELQLSRFAEVVRGEAGSADSTKKELSDDELKDATALVISGPFESLRPDEIESVLRFVERGGRIALMLHIGQPLGGLLARLDVDHTNASLHERNNVIATDSDFRVTNLTDSPLFAGLSQFSVYGCWALDPGKSGTVLAQTSGDAWVDLNGDKVLSRGDVVGAFNVAVTGSYGAGSFVVFGDDAVFQNRYLDESNGRLAANLARWLSGR